MTSEPSPTPIAAELVERINARTDERTTVRIVTDDDRHEVVASVSTDGTSAGIYTANRVATYARVYVRDSDWSDALVTTSSNQEAGEWEVVVRF